MKTNKIYHCLVFAAILTNSGCSLMGPKCQRLKLTDVFSIKNKNVVIVEYNKEGNCVPTIAGYQKKANLEHENPNTRYFWIQCKWITETQKDSIVNDFINNPRIINMD